ncbi:MAG: hypothetical protein IPK77_11785 [Cellvibrio sp.]|nr:hypothetical protein [Cellvibrio sp.]
MNCFEHKENSAVGICKACNKAVCSTCAKDTGNGLACSEKCEIEVSHLNQIVAKSKLIYNIGTNNTSIPSGILIHVFFSILFLGWSAYEYFATSRVNEFVLFMGLGFALMAIIMYRKLKKLNLNC